MDPSPAPVGAVAAGVAAHPSLPGLLAGLQRTFLNAMDTGLHALSRAAEDRWFKQSEAGGTLGAAAVDALRAWRLKESGWCQAIMRSQHEAWQRWAAPQDRAAPAAGLALVDEVDMERRLAWSAWRERAEIAAGTDLAALRQRWDHAWPQTHRLPPPWSVTVWVEHLDRETKRLDLPIAQEVVLVKLAESALLEAWVKACAQANRTLFEARILPEIGAATAAPPVPTLPSAPAQAAESPAAAPPPEVWTAISQWMAAHSTDRPGSHPAPLRDVHAALERLADRIPEQGWSPEEVKAHVRGDLERRLGPDVGLGAHELALDLISRMFAFVLKDRTMPPSAQLELVRLQLPYLFLALANHDLLAQPENAAKRLLDKLAEVARHINEDHRAAMLLTAIKTTVNEVIARRAEQPEWFEGQIAGLDAVLVRHRRLVGVTEHRTMEAAAGQERLQAARLQVATVLSVRTQNWRGPEWLRAVLLKPWAHHLVQAWLRQGEEGEPWRRGLRFVDHVLLFQRDGARGMADRLLPLAAALGGELRAGLTVTGVQPDQAARLSGLLVRHLHECVGRPPPPGAAPADAPATDDLASWPEAPETPPAAVTPAAAPGGPAASLVPRATAAPGAAAGAAGPTDAVREGYRAAALAIKPGEWVELVDDLGARRNIKLSWISHISGRRLFVTASGNRALEVAEDELVALMAGHRLYAMDTRPLTARALEAIAKTLSPAVSATDGTPDGRRADTVASAPTAPAPVKPLWSPLFDPPSPTTESAA